MTNSSANLLVPLQFTRKNDSRFINFPRRNTAGNLYEPPPLVLLWLARGLALAALGLAAYLVWTTTVEGSQVAGCGGEGLDCEHVLASRWSRWLGLPVSLPGVALYTLTFLGLLAIGPRTAERTQRDAWCLLVLLAVAASGAACWFVVLQVWVLHSLCLYCLATHGCGFLITGFVFWYSPLAWRRSAASNSPEPILLVREQGSCAPLVGRVFQPVRRDWTGWKTRPTHPRSLARARGRTPAWFLALLGWAGPGLLIGGQVLWSPQEPDLEVVERSGPVTSLQSPEILEQSTVAPVLISPALQPTRPIGDVAPIGAAPEPGRIIEKSTPPKSSRKVVEVSPTPPRPHREIPLLRGATSLDVYQYPIVGSPQSPYVLVKLFDYTCSYCRALHRDLEQARQHYGDQLAIVLLPVPMNPRCNPFVKVEQASHQKACEYAHLALAVWRAKPTAFETFHRWLMESVEVPSLEAARNQAAELLGANSMDQALLDPELDRQLEENCRLYALAGKGTIPKLIYNKKVISGRPASARQLFGLLEKVLGIPPLVR